MLGAAIGKRGGSLLLSLLFPKERVLSARISLSHFMCILKTLEIFTF